MLLAGAYFHFLGLAALVGCLVAEYSLLQPALHARLLQRLKRVDMAYGAIAGLMLASGLVRMYAEKGPEYYTGNPWFWSKMALFALAGIISIYPTVTFLRTKPDSTDIPLPAFKTIRLCLYIQLALVVGIIFCAVMMARG